MAKIMIPVSLTGYVYRKVQRSQSPITDLRVHKGNSISVAPFTYHLDHKACVVIGLP